MDGIQLLCRIHSVTRVSLYFTFYFAENLVFMIHDL